MDNCLEQPSPFMSYSNKLVVHFAAYDAVLIKPRVMLRAHLAPPRPFRATGSAVNQFCARNFFSAIHSSTMHPGSTVLCSATVDAASQPQAEAKPEEAHVEVELPQNIMSDVAERLAVVRVSGEPLPVPAASPLDEAQPGAAGPAPPAPSHANQPDQPTWSIANLPVDASRHMFGWPLDFRRVEGYAAAGKRHLRRRPGAVRGRTCVLHGLLYGPGSAMALITNVHA